jgi:hypothetical protein
MNNLFKSNSRFASLADEADNKKNDNNKKNNDKQKDNHFKQEKELNSRFKGAFENIEFKEREGEGERERPRNQFQKPIVPEVISKVEVKPIINIDEFKTSLSKSNIAIKEDKKPIISFAEKAAQNCTIGETIKFLPSKQIESQYEREYSEKQMAMDVLDALCDLHERETARQIERYGYDAWERMNKFEGWEEEEAYNQKLDDDYNKWLQREEEREIKEEEEREREEEYLANNDRFINYWKYN